MCDQQSLRSACAYAQSDQSLYLSLEYSMTVKLQTEHHLEFLSLKGDCTGSSESTLVKMSNCWKFHVMAQLFSLKMSCADPETFVWRAGYYRPYSGFAIEMAFRWPADCGPTLNADFVALRVLVGSEPVLLRNPIVLGFPMGPQPSPSGSAHECTATPRISLL